MELLLTSTCSSPAKTPSSNCEGRGACSSDAGATDGSASTERGSFEALLGSCAQGEAGSLKATSKDTSPAEQPLPVLGAGGVVSPCQDPAVEGSPQETAGRPESHPAGGESLLGLSDVETARAAGTTVSPVLESVGAQGVAGSSPSHRIGAEAHAPRSDGCPRPDEGQQDETAEGRSSSEEGGRAKGETQDAGPRITLSRMETLKGLEETVGKLGGDLKSDGQTGQGENAGSLAGKDGASWKQEVQMELPSRPAPPPVASNQAMPAHPAQAASGAAFRVIGDALHMRIRDEELGPMHWRIHMSGGRITAEAIVETSRVQELLQNHQNVLEAKLNALGEEMGSFQVSVDQGSQRFAAFSAPGGNRRSARSTEEAYADTGPEPVVWNVTGNTDRGLDLYA